MVPPEYAVFFTTMAATGATLFGLVFLTISIAPERIVAERAPLERQVKAATAYSALLNPLILSLFALVPHQQMGTVAAGLGISGLISTFPMAAVLLPKRVHFLHPDVNPVSRTISEYGLGRYGLLLTSAFVACGLGSLALAVGLRRGAARSGRSTAGLILLVVNWDRRRDRRDLPPNL